jgi:hypothetical protein
MKPTYSLLCSIGIVFLSISPQSARQESVSPRASASGHASYQQPSTLSDGWISALPTSVDRAQIERMTT